GGICAVSSGLVVLGSGLHSDIPYLVLFLLGLFPLQVMQQRVSLVAAVLFGASQALACFFRVDHLAFVAMSMVWLAWRSRPHGGVGVLLSTATMLVVFLPWQLHAADMVKRANT